MGQALQKFYEDPRLYVDMQDKSSRDYKEWSLEKWISLGERNPINFLGKSSLFFQYDQINKKLIVAPTIVEKQSSALLEHIDDILNYRTRLKVARLYKSKE